MKIHWTDSAIAHLVAAYDHIAKDSPRYAQGMIDRLTSRSKQIAAYPESGRKVPEYESASIREVIEHPYRIIYRVEKNRIDVLAVVHTARLLPPSV